MHRVAPISSVPPTATSSLEHAAGQTGCHHGRETLARTAGPFSFRVVEHPAGQYLRRHDHETAMLVFVASGGFHESGGARPRDLDEATLVYRPPGEPHINRFSGSGATCLIVEISPDWLGDAAAEGPWPDGVVFRKRGRASFLGRRLMHEWAFQDLLSPLAAEGFVLSLIEDLTRADPVTRGAPPAWLDHAEEIMRTRIRQPLSLGEIAAAVGVHHVTLARQFRSHHGCTVGEYLRAVRVETAARQLVNSTKSLTDIAHSTGFCDQSHMTRVVQRSLGLTPGRLRAEATGSPSNGSVP